MSHVEIEAAAGGADVAANAYDVTVVAAYDVVVDVEHAVVMTHENHHLWTKKPKLLTTVLRPTGFASSGVSHPVPRKFHDAGAVH